MTEAQFIAAIQALDGLEPVMVEQMMKIAPLMTEAERSHLLGEMTILSAKLIDALKEREQIAQDGLKMLEQIEKKEIPALRTAVEQSERNDELPSIEQNIQDAS